MRCQTSRSKMNMVKSKTLETKERILRNIRSHLKTKLS